MNEHLNTTQIVTVPLSGSLTMSSREVAELTGKRHDHVMRDARKMLLDLHGEEDLPKFGGVYDGGNGETRPCIHLPKRECLILVSGYSVELRARIIDRWMELEEGATPKALDFSDPRVVLGVIGHLQGEVAKKDEIIAEQGGRLKRLDRLEGAKGSMCITDAAKTLDVKRDHLFQFMSSRRWIYKRAGNKNWLAYDTIRHAGYLEHEDHLYMDNEGRERVAPRVLVTAKGLVKLAELLERPLH
ncbi:hypothetical protein B5M44_19195 [Shinella sumterensis]|uniref:Rha family transcriptional regulator n=1 Tax=Shinella sumterensis TaxID=1967501 RepID=UPI00106EB16B|nr:phage regulatory protein/antirepressor Ant [Shinella sumterensis]MCD1266076.1 hypothetical protein [Shinella sumterensis]TFE96565.1 hypothetical protein B5M44_19195 [Shinella sumterensis]